MSARDVISILDTSARALSVAIAIRAIGKNRRMARIILIVFLLNGSPDL